MQINIRFLPTLEYSLHAAQIIETLMYEDDFFKKIIFAHESFNELLTNLKAQNSHSLPF